MLPANSFVGLRAFRPLRSIQVDEVNYDLLGTQNFGKLTFTCRFVAEDDNFGGAHHVFEVGGKHGPDVRDDFFDVLAVGSDQSAE